MHGLANPSSSADHHQLLDSCFVLPLVVKGSEINRQHQFLSYTNLLCLRWAASLRQRVWTTGNCCINLVAFKEILRAGICLQTTSASIKPGAVFIYRFNCNSKKACSAVFRALSPDVKGASVNLILGIHPNGASQLLLTSKQMDTIKRATCLSPVVMESKLHPLFTCCRLLN